MRDWRDTCDGGAGGAILTPAHSLVCRQQGRDHGPVRTTTSRRGQGHPNRTARETLSLLV